MSGVLLDGLISVADRAFAVRNDLTPAGVEQPTSAVRVGQPRRPRGMGDAGASWPHVHCGGPSVEDIATLTDDEAMEPVRILRRHGVGGGHRGSR